MTKRLLLIYLLSSLIQPLAAQQNWAAISCFNLAGLSTIDRMFVDSLHNEIILMSSEGHKICNTTFKGFIAYNGNNFHDLDFGVNKYDPNPGNGGFSVLGCIPYNNKTLFGGAFYTVGSDTLYSKGIAQWNGAVWDTFPKHCFSNKINSSNGGLWGFLKHDGKLWMYGTFDTIGTTITKNITSFDGNNFSSYNIPVVDNYAVQKMIVYKNKIIAAGPFYSYTPNSISRLAMYDGTSWASVGNGIVGSIAFVYDMAIYKDTLYIAGTWDKSAGNVSNYIMKWDGNQLSDAGFGDFCGWGNVRNLVPFNNRLYAFGNFICAANQKAFGVAYYESGTWTVPQDSIDNSAISSAVVYNDAIYIGGGFKSINGDTSIQKFAKLICPDFDATAGCVSGLKESSNKLDIKIFPNPAKDKLYFEFEQNSAIDKISILNPLGQVVYKLVKPLPKQEMDVSQLPAGIYFLKAENKQDQGVFKVVKE